MIPTNLKNITFCVLLKCAIKVMSVNWLAAKMKRAIKRTSCAFLKLGMKVLQLSVKQTKLKRGNEDNIVSQPAKCSNNIVASGVAGSKNEADSDELFASASSFEYSHTIEQILKRIQLIEEGKYGKFDEEKEGNGKRELMEVIKTPEDPKTCRKGKDLGFLIIENDILRTKLKRIMAECSSLKDRVNRVEIVACYSDQENQRVSARANEDGHAIEGRKPAGDIGGLSMATCGMHGKSHDCLTEDVFSANWNHFQQNNRYKQRSYDHRRPSTPLDKRQPRMEFCISEGKCQH